MPKAETKIVTREELTVRLAEARREHKQIVFANGCFDTLHVGHVRYLAGARKEGDLLVVGVNSDSSMKELKGPGRPILDERARALLVAAHRDVDYVIIFPEPTVEELLRVFRPDVHAKGTDYTTATVPERNTAAKLGIRIAIVGDPKNHSTRGFIDSVRKGRHG